MTAQGHNKIIGFAYVVFGGLLILFVIPIIILSMFILGAASKDDMGGGIAAFGILFSLIFIAAAALFCLVGWGILKVRWWGRVLGIIVGGFLVLSFPGLIWLYNYVGSSGIKGSILGLILGIYTLWFLFSEDGQKLFLTENHKI